MGAAVRHARCGLVLLKASLERRPPMLDRPSDDEVSRQILGIFMRHRIPATGILQRNNFFDVRDGDFQRGLNKAAANNWITVDPRNRYRYQHTATGYAVWRMIAPGLSRPTISYDHRMVARQADIARTKGPPPITPDPADGPPRDRRD